MNLFFYHPLYLAFFLLIPVLAIVHLYSLKYVERKALLFANYKAIERITGGEVLPKNYSILALRSITLALFVLATAGPMLSFEVPSHKYDLVIAIDSSSSMSATDILPNRFDAVKLQTTKFLEALPEGSRVGVISFASTAVLVKHVESEGNGLEEYANAVNALNIQRIGGTAIGDAIMTGTNALLASDREKAILLLTDGKSNTGVALDLATKYAKDSSIKVFPIGIGTANATTATGIESGVDETELKKIASETGGAYYPAPTREKLESAFASVAEKESMRTEFLSLSLFLIPIAFLLVFIDWALSSSRYRIIP